MDGQISIFDYQDQRKREIAKRLPIPPLEKKYIDQEGWCDDWHYCELEEPPEMGHWDSWKKEFRKDYEKFYETTFAWVRIPSLYLRVDKSLHEMLGLKGIIGGE